MCSLKIHNVLLSRVSNDVSITVFTLAKLNQSTKYMLKVAKEMLANGESSKFNFTYKVTPFLVFVVAKIRFISREETYVLNAAGVYLLKVNYEYDRRNCGICSKLTVKTLKRSQLTLLRYHLALVRLRSSHLRCSIKKLFLTISQFSQENTYVGVSF